MENLMFLEVPKNKFDAYFEIIRKRMANNLPLHPDTDLRWLR